MKWMLTVLLFLSMVQLKGQEFEQPGGMLALGLVMQSYKGDLSSYGNYSAGFHISMLFNQKENWNGGVNLSVGTISGQKVGDLPSSGTPQPNNFFKTTTITVHYDLRYNFIREEHWKVYASLGVGLLRFKPKDEFDNDLQDFINTRADNEIYGNLAAVFPLQIGAMYFLDNGFGGNFQLGFMNPTTDYLDNISELGEETGADNALQFRFALMIPL